jgi:hypothetical protein
LPKKKRARRNQSDGNSVQDSRVPMLPSEQPVADVTDNTIDRQQEETLTVDGARVQPSIPPTIVSTDSSTTLPPVDMPRPPASDFYRPLTLQPREVLRYTSIHPKYNCAGVKRYDERPSSYLFMPRVVTCIGML